ncbi:MAG TPA: BTAD domain-containing putative transcriptional regulator [Candidatus Aquilonibacter sp.]|nr:BTAD domain-containing putative transcriptional regulator [Candidatus Aquilonibacter sp.]
MRPAILGLMAPAGYGKSAVLAQLASGRRTLRCDCRGLRDDLDLAMRLFPMLSDRLEDGARTSSERLEDAVAAFATVDHELVVFDAAEFIADRPEALEFFARLLARRPPGITIAVASRSSLGIRLTRLAAPHEVLVLRASDLAFDDDEIRSLFVPFVTDAPTLRRIRDVSRGWPVVLFLLLRLARERRLRPLLGRLEDAAFHELYEYLNDEVLAQIDQPTRRALFACAALPHAEDRDLGDLALDALAGDDLSAFAKESPFLERQDDGSYEIHPIVGALLTRHQEERRRLLLTQLARQREMEGNAIRAAELYVALGEEDLAASVLSRHRILRESRPPARYFGVLSRISSAAVQRYPLLWGMQGAMRMFREPIDRLLDEADSMWRTIPRSAPLYERYTVFVLRIMLMGFLGRMSQARATVHEMMIVQESEFTPHLAALRAFLRARSGALTAAQADANAAMVLNADMASAFLLLTLAEIARGHGDRMETQLLERAMTASLNSGLQSLYALSVAQSLACAWLANDASRLAQLAATLDRLVDAGFRGFVRLASAALQRETHHALDDVPEFSVYAALIEMSNARDARRRVHLAQEAFAGARRAQLPFLEVLASLAVALSDRDAFDDYIARAGVAAAAIESLPLQQSIDAIRKGESACGMLDGFVRQISRPEADVNAPIDISFATAAVRVDGATVELGGRELELLLAIATRREPSSRARLASLLWPDLDDAAARNAFSVCLHRLRARIERKDAIERDGEGYRLHAHASVDLWDMARLAGTRQAMPLQQRDRDAAERLWQRLSAEMPIATERWEWFEPFAQQLREGRIHLAHILGRDALERKEAHAALHYADDALRADPCDEEAVEIGLRAELLLQNRAAAMHRYRQYRAALQRDIGAEPSFSLTALVTGT